MYLEKSSTRDQLFSALKENLGSLKGQGLSRWLVTPNIDGYQQGKKTHSTSTAAETTWGKK
jgi:hypothetical protein